MGSPVILSVTPSMKVSIHVTWSSFRMWKHREHSPSLGLVIKTKMYSPCYHTMLSSTSFAAYIKNDDVHTHHVLWLHKCIPTGVLEKFPTGWSLTRCPFWFPHLYVSDKIVCPQKKLWSARGHEKHSTCVWMSEHVVNLLPDVQVGSSCWPVWSPYVATCHTKRQDWKH